MPQLHLLPLSEAEALDALHFPAFLFNQPAHARLQGGEAWAAEWRKGQRIEARLLFFRQGQALYSPLRAPFGSVEMRQGLSYASLYAFLEAFEAFCRQEGFQSLRLGHYPLGYAPEAPLLVQVLWALGYHSTCIDLCQHLPVSAQVFAEGLHTSEKRRLRKCTAAGFVFEEWKNPDLAQVYAFVKACRLRKGFPISMSEEAFQALWQHFPEAHRVFCVKDGAEIAALSVTIAVNKQILYNFYPADHPDYLAFSPTVFLMQGIYEFAQKNKFNLLDLGISTEQGRPNQGLIRFKECLGASPSLKYTFLKTF